MRDSSLHDVAGYTRHAVLLDQRPRPVLVWPVGYFGPANGPLVVRIEIESIGPLRQSKAFSHIRAHDHRASLRRTRIVLAGISQVLSEIIRDIVTSQADMDLVGQLAI